MWIKRDILDNFNLKSCLESLFFRGPRQTGKSSILTRLQPEAQSLLFLDDLALKQSATEDPQFLFDNSKFPILIDEAHLAPPLFFEIKRRIDQSRRERLLNKSNLPPGSFRLTGSNQTLIDKVVKETLAGRVSIFYLLGLSYHELSQFDPSIQLSEIFFRGGFPELWVRKEINPIFYLNDYISTFIEKDLALSAGIEKRREFLNTLRLTAARVGELLNYESISRDSGVSGNAIKEWLSLLETNHIIAIVNPYFNNLNKRLIKMPKVYFLDVGLCVRLQAHQEPQTILQTPQAGHLFETLVYSEIIKTKQNFFLEYEVYFWRTKEKEEIDFIVSEKNRMTLIEVKLASGATQSFPTPATLLKENKIIRKCYVVAAGERRKMDQEIEIIPLKDLTGYLQE